MFFFGVEPPAPIGFIKPMSIAVAGPTILVTDAAHRAVLACSASHSPAAASLNPALTNPTVVITSPDGGLVVADGAAGIVNAYDPSARLARSYRLPDSRPFRPAGLACVGGELWVSNSLAHGIEVFDFASGAHARTIGQRGRGPADFGVPLGMATTPAGDVCIVDMLNARVQILDPTGKWLRDIGSRGEGEVYFSCPKSVAVGPDGIIFVSDAASQAVEAFDVRGRLIASFGGAADGPRQLMLPAGIAVVVAPQSAAGMPPSSFAPDYYILAAEQFLDPGVRVFAWRTQLPESRSSSANHAASSPTAKVRNPHWTTDAAACTTCHIADAANPGPIAPATADAACLACHDGKAAPAEKHSIGWPGVSDRTHAPPDWPLVNGRLGCLTCHNMSGHDTASGRPADNPVFLRSYDSQDPLKICTNCHTTEKWRISPHRLLAEDEQSVDSCAFCHTTRPPVPDNGRRAFAPSLRNDGSRVCLACHKMHADAARKGHLDAVLPPEMLKSMLLYERETAARRGVDMSDATTPELLPLENGRVACFTCHNPHPRHVFPSHSVLEARGDSPASQKASLRAEAIDLCVICHRK